MGSHWVALVKGPMTFVCQRRHRLNVCPMFHRFLGLLDTVGALGVPKVDPGMGLDYEFYDQDVSWEVQTVCQALATHDRVSVLSPCFVRRPKATTNKFYQTTTFETEEVWFPGVYLAVLYSKLLPETHFPRLICECVYTGAHWDIGRQRFVLGRKGHGLEGLFHDVLTWTNLLHTNITYVPDLANPPLWWLINRVQAAQVPGVGGHGVLQDVQPSACAGEWARDRWPPLWRLPGMAPYQKDAFNKLFDSLLRIMNPLGIFPVVDDGLRGLLATLLIDRNIPEYFEQPACFCKLPGETDAAAAAKYYDYISQTYQDFADERFRQSAWVTVRPTLQVSTLCVIQGCVLHVNGPIYGAIPPAPGEMALCQSRNCFAIARAGRRANASSLDMTERPGGAHSGMS